jgi:hypothetical protein
MTQEQQDKLRKALYNAKFTTDAEDENPFVGVYFDDLLAIIEEYIERPIYHEGWLAGEANLAKEYKNIQWVKWVPVEKRLPEKEEEDPDVSVDVLVTDGKSCYTSYYNFRLKMWKWGEDIIKWAPLPLPPQDDDDVTSTGICQECKGKNECKYFDVNRNKCFVAD